MMLFPEPAHDRLMRSMDQKRLTFRNNSESVPDLNGPDLDCQRICKKRRKARDIPYRVSDIGEKLL